MRRSRRCVHGGSARCLIFLPTPDFGLREAKDRLRRGTGLSSPCAPNLRREKVDERDTLTRREDVMGGPGADDGSWGEGSGGRLKLGIDNEGAKDNGGEATPDGKMVRRAVA